MRSYDSDKGKMSVLTDQGRFLSMSSTITCNTDMTRSARLAHVCDSHPDATEGNGGTQMRSAIRKHNVRGRIRVNCFSKTDL